jgi:hypothetical protein
MYIAHIAHGEPPEEVIREDGFRDPNFVEGTEFNKYSGEFGYRILQLEAIDDPITLSDLKERNWLQGAPQKYCYVREAMADAMRDIKTTPIFSHSETNSCLENLEIRENGGETIYPFCGDRC